MQDFPGLPWYLNPPCPKQVIEKKTKPYIQVDIGGGQTKTFAPEEISAMVLTKMKETAEAYLGKKVRRRSLNRAHFFLEEKESILSLHQSLHFFYFHLST